jgi:hypothetical protein
MASPILFERRSEELDEWQGPILFERRSEESDVVVSRNFYCVNVKERSDRAFTQ